MLHHKLDKTNTVSKSIIIGLLLAGVITISILFYWHSRDDENTEPSAAATISDAEKKLGKEFDHAQETAAMAAISGKPASDKMKQRPDYVSEIEWQVLQNEVEHDHNGSEEKLTGLVNNLLFIKKKDAWVSSEENSPQRRQLARELLDMLPQQLETEGIDPGEAKELKIRLAEDLK